MNEEKADILDQELILDRDREKLDKVIIESIVNNRLDKLSVFIKTIHIADLADLIDRLPIDARESLIITMEDSIPAELLVEIENISILESIIRHLGIHKVSKLISQLDIDDAISVLVDLDEETKNKIIANVDEAQRKELYELFSYPENSVGRIMQKKFVAVPDNWHVGQIIDFVKQSKNIPKEFYEVFVVDNKYRPIGYANLASILQHKREILINEIIRTDMKVIDVNVDQEEVSFLFRQYGLISVPVVNKMGRLVGAITYDDALEVIEKEAEEDIMHMGGVNETDFHDEILEIVKARFPWLFINLLTATLAALVISLFEDTIHNIVLLAAIFPIVASMGGNAGTQTMTVSVVALSTKELGAINAGRVIGKQIIACTLSGILVATIGSIFMYIWHQNLYLSAVFAGSLIVNFALAGFFGSSIPIFIHKIGLDPAIASPIFLTALTDICGSFTFLALAALFLM